jgi:hypothetical protein
MYFADDPCLSGQIQEFEGKGNETLKSKTCLFQEYASKELLTFQHANVENSLLCILKKHEKCPSVNKMYFRTTERRGTLSLDYLT